MPSPSATRWQTAIRRAIRPRVVIYTLLLCALTFATAWSIATRPLLRVEVQKDDRSSLAREADDGMIENTFRLRSTPATPRVNSASACREGNGLQLAGETSIAIPAGEYGALTLIVRAEPGSLPKGPNRIDFKVSDATDSNVSAMEKSRFWMP